MPNPFFSESEGPGAIADQISIAIASVLTAIPWSAATAYAPDQVVTYSGALYFCTVTRTATATTPDVDTTHWGVVTGLLPLLYYLNASNLVSGTVPDARLPAYALAMIGEIRLFAGAAAPSRWLLCQGQSLLRATYPALFTAIGTVFGSADGTHFTLPDMRGRAPIGVGTGAGLTARALAASGGEETHVLSTGELPAHTHAVALGIHDGTADGTVAMGEQGGNATSELTTDTGGGAAHNTMQPFLALNYIIYAGV